MGRFTEFWVKVFPGGVGSFYQGYLLGSGEPLQLFLAGYSFVGVLEVFEIDETVDGVTRGVSAGELFVVGGDAVDEVACHAGV